MSNIPVKWYTSTQQGAPQLGNNWGDLVALLDAVLVNGFNSRTLTSLTQAGGIATATSAGHLFQVDQVVSVSGANQPDYNGEFRVLSANSVSFTFAVQNNPVATATGTISAKYAPLNFEKTFSGTHKGVYRSTNPNSNKPYFRVDNSLNALNTAGYPKKGKVTLAEAMTDIDTFVPGAGRAPYLPATPYYNEGTTGSGVNVVDGWYKWYYARPDTAGSGESWGSTTGDRDWVLVGDDRGFYFMTEFQPGSPYGKVMYAMTDFESFKPGDGYNTLLFATEWYTSAAGTWTGSWHGPDFSSYSNRSHEYTGKVCMRDHTQVGGTCRLSLIPLGTKASQMFSGTDSGVPFPNGPDYSLVVHPIYLMQETSNHLRGIMPGIRWVQNSSSPYLDKTVLSNVTGMPGRKLLVVALNRGEASAPVARMVFDITGPWW